MINGGAWKQSEYVNDGIPVVQVSNMKNGTIDIIDLKYISASSYDRYKTHTLKENDLIIATVGSHATQASAAGRATIVKDFAAGMLLNQNAVAIRSKSDALDQKYLGLLGSSIQFQSYLGTAGKGAANQVRIALSSIRQYKCDLPPVKTQQQIADVMSAYDDLIENNRRRIQLLEQAARLLYREWFVRLRFPGHEHVRIKDGVPEGWERKKLGEIAPLNYGKALKEDDREPGPFPVYGSSGIIGTHAKAIVKGPSIIVGRKGNVGSVFWSSCDYHPIDTVYFVESSNCSHHLYYALQHISFINTDVAVPGLNRDLAHSRIILIPEPRIHRLFEENVVPLHEQMDILVKQNLSLTNARDMLLPRLMNGVIKI